jgi:hypothetical protein
MKSLLLFSLIVLCFLVIEVLFAVRVFLQATAEPIETEEVVRLFELTDDLAAPFEPLTGEPPLRTTGVIDFTVLVAMEGYFVITLGVVFVLFFLGRIIDFLSRHRSQEPPPFVAKIEAPRRRRQAWQPLATAQHRGKRFYLTFTLPEDAPAHAKAGLLGPG